MDSLLWSHACPLLSRQVCIRNMISRAFVSYVSLFISHGNFSIGVPLYILPSFISRFSIENIITFVNLV